MLFKETKNKTFSIGKKMKYLIIQPPKHKIIHILVEIFPESLVSPSSTDTHKGNITQSIFTAIGKLRGLL